ncbi:TetR/AcrR family transcriptional regulator [Sphingomonas bacterium]|uniref:TetR/AcrR family transcriptional regulator n=1 Tax=Sphingomonas bacterium TaxID=1895847 RepID=UPI001575E598|nr:TetR/AcrR family transcriptional regulator [Sphingomonas bacterium]
MEAVACTVPVKGRPREFCPETALASALRVFWSKGYEGASLTDLTEAMGIGRPSLYAAFGNKEALFRSALDLYEREKLSYIALALAAPTSREVAERLLHGALDSQTSSCEPHGCLGVIGSMACGSEAEGVRAEVIARRASSHAALVARMERARDEGDLPAKADPAGLARFLIAILQGMAVQAGAGASREELAQLIDTGLAIWPGR